MQALDGEVFEGFAIDFHDQFLAESIDLKDHAGVRATGY